MKYIPLLVTLILVACGTQNETQIEKEPTVDSLILQGHRGCRGLMPENSIPAFEKAIRLGVSTLELDVVLSQDLQLVVSHESWMNPLICFKPDGQPLSEEEGKSLNLFEMPLQEIQSYSFGSKGHPDFPSQQMVSCNKPTLAEVVKSARIKAQELKKPMPNFDIEIKSSESGDGIYHPKPAIYARLFLEEYFKLHIEGKATVQSFDKRILQELHRAYPELPLVLLVEPGISSLAHELDQLGFEPFGFSPHFSMVTDSLVQMCQEKGIHLSTWTVNESSDINRLLDIGVRDIITDYPDKVLKAAQDRGLEIQH